MRFSIRDLLWLTLVVALAIGWWVDRSRLDSRYQFLINRLESGRLLAFDSSGQPYGWRWPLPSRSAPAPNPPNK